MCSIDREWPNGILRRNCSNRIISTGGSPLPTLAALIMQLLGMALFFAFPARYLYEEKNNAAAYVLGSILAFSSLVCFGTTALMDPGVIPPSDITVYQFRESRPPRTQHITTSQGRCTIRYCDECNIFRPPRVEHCPTCRNCIMKYDHHCPWVGNCIGERNYRFFFGFLCSICSFVLICVACSISELVLRNMNVSSFDVQSAGSLALLIYSILCGTFVFALCGLHSFLIAKDKTTFELLREFVKADEKKPGLRTACVSFVNICGPTTPSLVREYYRNTKSGRLSSTSLIKEVSPNELRELMFQSSSTIRVPPDSSEDATSFPSREGPTVQLVRVPIDYEEGDDDEETGHLSEIQREIAAISQRTNGAISPAAEEEHDSETDRNVLQSSGDDRNIVLSSDDGVKEPSPVVKAEVEEEKHSESPEALQGASDDGVKEPSPVVKAEVEEEKHSEPTEALQLT